MILVIVPDLYHRETSQSARVPCNMWRLVKVMQGMTTMQKVNKDLAEILTNIF